MLYTRITTVLYIRTHDIIVSKQYWRTFSEGKINFDSRWFSLSISNGVKHITHVRVARKDFTEGEIVHGHGVSIPSNNSNI